MNTPLSAFTRRMYVDDETIISICNYCYAMVAESSDEAELDRLEAQHSCIDKAEAFAA